MRGLYASGVLRKESLTRSPNLCDAKGHFWVNIVNYFTFLIFY